MFSLSLKDHVIQVKRPTFASNDRVVKDADSGCSSGGSIHFPMVQSPKLHVCWCPESKGFRSFRYDRVKSIKVLEYGNGTEAGANY